MPNVNLTLGAGKTRTLTMQPLSGGVPTSNAENPTFVENGGPAYLTIVPGSTTPPFTADITALPNMAGQNATVRCGFDGHQGDGVVPVEVLAFVTIVAPDANDAEIVVGPEV